MLTGKKNDNKGAIWCILSVFLSMLLDLYQPKINYFKGN